MSYYPPAPKKSKAMPILLGVVAFVVVACGGSMIAVAVVGGQPPKRPAATRAAGQEAADPQRCDPGPDLSCGVPDGPCATNRLGKYFDKDGVRYTCSEPKPYAWRPAPPSSPAAPPPAAGPATAIDDGTYTVGAGPDNIAAGTYKVTGADKKCYWAIYKSGQNQDFSAMVNNHLGGGNLSVTLKAGQDFETKRCGTWKRAG